MNEQLQTLCDMLVVFPGKENLNIRAILAESYIQSYGPIPNEYGELIRELLAGNISAEEALKKIDSIANGDIYDKGTLDFEGMPGT